MPNLIGAPPAKGRLDDGVEMDQGDKGSAKAALPSWVDKDNIKQMKR